MITLPKLNGSINVWVKPNSDSTEILGYDKEKNLLRISLKSKPQDGKANLELVKFLKKLTKKQARIKTGLKSRKKVVVFG